MTMPAGERCARFLRVSTDKQESRLEMAEVDRHIAERGYVTARTFELNVSASSGAHEPVLEEILADIRAFRYSVVVIVHSSRIDRRDPEKQDGFLLDVRMAGGRVESVREPLFGQRDLGGKIQTIVAQEQNARYSADLKGHISAAIREMAERGAFLGSVPWGFAAAGPRRERQLVPQLAATWAAPVLERVAAGESTGEVARWLTDLNVPSGRGGREQPDKRWWARSVGLVVRCTALTGRTECSYTVTDQATGQRETLRWIHRSEPVVSAALFVAVNAALDARRDNWRSHGGRKPSDVLSGAVRCHSCGSPLYKLANGYYRCMGRGAARKNCGVPQVPLAVAGQLADMAWSACRHQLVEEKWEPGNAAAVQLRRADLEQRERIIAASSMSRAERRRAQAELDVEFEANESTVIEPDKRVAVLLDRTWAQEWEDADTDGKRDLVRNGYMLLSMGLADGSEDFSVRFTTRQGRNQRAEGRPVTRTWGIWVAYSQDWDG